MKIACSACLCGIKCRYDGRSNTVLKLKELYDKGEVLPICPEVLGGLDTPRCPSEIVCGKVINTLKEDNTDFFNQGAIKALEILRNNRIKLVVLKEKSPSCGTNYIYDGTFSGKVIKGMGVAAKLFKENGIDVISDEEWND